MKTDVKNIMIYLDSGCIRRNNIDPQAQYQVWLDMFEPYSDDELKAAAVKWMKKSQYFPSVKEFSDLLPAKTTTPNGYGLLMENREQLELDYYTGGKISQKEWQILENQFRGIGFEMAADRLVEKYNILQEAKNG